MAAIHLELQVHLHQPVHQNATHLGIDLHLQLYQLHPVINMPHEFTSGFPGISINTAPVTPCR
jgi:hypothetical protein